MGSYQAKKRLGQNFLKDKAVIDRIVSLIKDQSNIPIVEVGSGRGALTLTLAQNGFDIFAVEFDRDLIPYLSKLLSDYDNVKIINEDILKFNPEDQKLTNFNLIGNIPYNITSPLIDWLIISRNKVNTVYLMVQKEMAERITSLPGSKNWSPIAIMTQLFFSAEFCFVVDKKSFHPQPDVQSAIIRLSRKQAIIETDFELLKKIVQQSFRHRRKQLINNLVPEIISTSEQFHELMDNLSLAHNVRAEEITIDQFLKLTEHLKQSRL